MSGLRVYVIVLADRREFERRVQVAAESRREVETCWHLYAQPSERLVRIDAPGSDGPPVTEPRGVG